MENIIELHKSIFQDIEIKANSGIFELREFCKILEEKMDSERAAARASKKFSQFQLQHLNQSKYGRIFDEMLNVAESKSVQAYELVKSISQDIYDPLKSLVETQGHAVTGLTYEGRRAMKETRDLDLQLQSIKLEYFRSKSEMAKSIENYEKYKSETVEIDKNTEFYRDKLFKQMNAKMRVWQEKANLYEIWVKKSNENLNFYTEKMQGLVRVFAEMAQERKQIMTDSLNKLVLFETSVDMNLKYDTKMFTRMIDDLQVKEQEVRHTDEPTQDSIKNSSFEKSNKSKEIVIKCEQKDVKISPEKLVGLGKTFFIIT